jgi:hypothetical protein
MVYIGFYAILFLFMFSDFYTKAYIRSSSGQRKGGISSKEVDQLPDESVSGSSNNKISTNNNACLVMKHDHLNSVSEMDSKKLL